LDLRSRRHLTAGRYTLELRSRSAGRSMTTRTPLTLD
jgi:hypothetical protein